MREVLVGRPSVTCPAGSCDCCFTATVASSTWRRMVLAYWYSSSPGVVARAPCAPRCSSLTPSSASRLATCWLSEGCATKSDCAAAVMLSSSTMRAKYFSCFRSMRDRRLGSSVALQYAPGPLALAGEILIWLHCGHPGWTIEGQQRVVCGPSPSNSDRPLSVFSSPPARHKQRNPGMPGLAFGTGPRHRTAVARAQGLLSPPACAGTPESRSRPSRCWPAHPPSPPPACARCATRWGC